MKRPYQLTSGLSPGPLQEILATFIPLLSARGYSRYAVDEKRRLLIQFDQWLLKGRVRIEDLTEVHAQGFVGYRHRERRNRGSDASTVRSLIGYLRDQAIIPPPLVRSSGNFPDRLLASFDQYLSEKRGLTSATRSWYLYETRRFISESILDGRVSLKDLSAREVTRFMLARASFGGVQRTATALRSFLGFLFSRGDIDIELSHALPRVARRVSGDLPKYLLPEDVERLLKASKGNTGKAKRNNAILLLLARLGLRAGEIVQMTLDDVDWDGGELSIRGKGGRCDRLPLPHEVGEALAAYLREGRPACGSRRVFIRLAAPYQGLAGASSISFVVRAALKQAQLSPSTKGAHLLRHSLATRMLRGGASLGDIGRILRHQLPSTTAIYAKVDVAALRALALPWPGGVA